MRDPPAGDLTNREHGNLGPMTVEVFLWQAPRDLDAEQAAQLVATWQAAGGDPAASPFEPSTDIGWFARELTEGARGLEIVTDATPRVTRVPIWASGSDEAPARVVGIGLPPGTPDSVLDDIVGLAAKYDLILFDARSGSLHRPLELLAAYASATFWPRGAIRAAVAGMVGVVIAVVAWTIGIPLVSGLLALIGAFLALMAVVTFVPEIRRLAGRRSDPPPRA